MEPANGHIFSISRPIVAELVLEQDAETRKLWVWPVYLGDPIGVFMKASDLFIRALENEGVEYIFGIPGEENLDLLESLRDPGGIPAESLRDPCGNSRANTPPTKE